MSSQASRPEERNMDKAAACGEPSYVWREGQERRYAMILRAAGERLKGRILENGCGVGMYLERLKGQGEQAIGLEYDFDRSAEARQRSPEVVNAAGENLPFPDASFDFILSHEVIEHVHSDRQALAEMARVLCYGGRIALFAPNRGYPFETHGIFWRGRYRFGNIPLVNYLPRPWRDRLAPHVRVYTSGDIRRLVEGLPLHVVERTVIFGAYDNIIRRFPTGGKYLRKFLQAMEKTPLKALGLSHFWVLEKAVKPEIK